MFNVAQPAWRIPPNQMFKDDSFEESDMIIKHSSLWAFRNEQSDIDVAKFCTSVETTPSVFHMSMFVVLRRNGFLAAT